MGKAALQDPHGGIWYFAYGSNLRLSVLENRGIKALDIKAVIVPSHYLTFDIFGIPYAEPSFASVAPFAPEKKTTLRLGDSPASRDVPPVQGLAYLLNPRDYRQLVISEGGGVAYDEVEVHASILDKDGKPDPGATLIARTLQAKYPWRPNGAPSARYLVSGPGTESCSAILIGNRASSRRGANRMSRSRHTATILIPYRRMSRRHPSMPRWEVFFS